ncbi:MAG: 30S ribosomal protein S6e [Nanoarchaeota archaeon]|nr:30S ribosomal protein S6e [Nanoarchaeota archaeon]
MAFKFNISTKDGKTFKLEAEAEELIDKKLHDKIEGKEISTDLEGYEFEITGTSDKAGFTSMTGIQGIGLKKVLLDYGKGMKNRPKKEGKKKRSDKKPKGLRLRKTVRGEMISSAITQINLKVLKDGKKKLSEIFPEQNRAPEPPKEETTSEEKKE